MHCPSREEILRLVGWFYPSYSVHLSKYVDQQTGIRRVWIIHRPQEVLLNYLVVSILASMSFSDRCGLPNKNTMNPVHPSFTESVFYEMPFLNSYWLKASHMTIKWMVCCNQSGNNQPFEWEANLFHLFNNTARVIISTEIFQM